MLNEEGMKQDKMKLPQEVQCNHCDYKSRCTWWINRYSLEKHGIQRNNYGAADSLPKKDETIEYDKKIYKLLQRMKQDKAK